MIHTRSHTNRQNNTQTHTMTKNHKKTQRFKRKIHNYTTAHNYTRLKKTFTISYKYNVHIYSYYVLGKKHQYISKTYT